MLEYLTVVNIVYNSTTFIRNETPMPSSFQPQIGNYRLNIPGGKGFIRSLKIFDYF